MVEFFATRGCPLQELDRAVDRYVFLVARDQERDRSIAVMSGLAAMVCKVLQYSRDAAGDAALHVDGAAAIQIAVLNVARERAVAPRAFLAWGHNVGVAGKGDVGSRGADPCKQVIDIGGAGFTECDAVHLKARAFEDIFQYV